MAENGVDLDLAARRDGPPRWESAPRRHTVMKLAWTYAGCRVGAPRRRDAGVPYGVPIAAGGRTRSCWGGNGAAIGGHRMSACAEVGIRSRRMSGSESMIRGPHERRRQPCAARITRSVVMLELHGASAPSPVCCEWRR